MEDMIYFQGGPFSRKHPIIKRYLRQQVLNRFYTLVLLVAVALFLLLGGLSLPVLYCLFSLMILLHITVSTTDKIYAERESYTWELMRVTPLTSRELLLSVWAASVWQLNRTWMMIAYRVSHALIIVGVIVFSLLFADLPTEHWLPVLVSGTLVIVLQPYTEMYFSGMIAIAGASRLRDRGNALGLAVTATTLYWLIYVGLILGMFVVYGFELSAVQLLLIFFLPMVISMMLGFFAQRLAEVSI
jgi:hypothetical protein